MRFSIIIPSYNQHEFIEKTLLNALAVKEAVKAKGDVVEVLLFDSDSEPRVQTIIEKYRSQLDHVEVRKDDGQYEAINKGIIRAKGDFWTWLNTDDTLDIPGFIKMADILRADPLIDYIYGSIDYINSADKVFRTFHSYPVTMETLVHRTPGIFQQGSFFRSAFTEKLGLMRKFDCCFDYEYVLRCLSKNARVYCCDFKVANFRQHAVSKTGSRTPVFIREQLTISKYYGRRPFDFLTWFSKLRLLKHKLFPR
jgi:glycosyltransferase involved in cell wall biosynthesis